MAVLSLRTFGDIWKAVCEELGFQTTDTLAINRTKRDINIVYAELVAEKEWQWLQARTTLQLPPYLSNGTASVTTGSSVVTLSLPVDYSRQGYKFAIDGYSEIYTVESSTSGSATLYLGEAYTGPNGSACGYKIWTDRLALPVNCIDIVEATHDHRSTPMDRVGLQEYRRITGPAPRAEGHPAVYTIGEAIKPSGTALIAGLPALASRSSSGVTKTLVFSSTLPNSITDKVGRGEAVRLRVSHAGDPTYNGEVQVGQLATTLLSNDTLVYTGRGELSESATADASLQVVSLIQTVSYDTYRPLIVYPALVQGRTSIHVDYIKDVPDLENDNDEPLIPLKDRSVLLYGALARGWKKRGNPTESDYNQGLYGNKLAKMQGKLQESQDKPRLVPSKLYMGAKRNTRTGGYGSAFGAPAQSGGPSGAIVTGTPNTVAIFGNNGEATGSGVSTTELSALAGVTTSVQTQFNAANTGINRLANALDAVPAGNIVTVDASGLPLDAGVAATNFAYLAGAQALTTVTLSDAIGTPQPAVTWNAATYNSIAIMYSLSRGVGNLESGIINITQDSSNAAMAQGASAVLGNLGVTFSVDVSGSLLRLLYTTTATGSPATLKFKMQQWLAT